MQPNMLIQFNSVALGQRLYAQLSLMLDEIRLMLSIWQREGLEQKASAALPLWFLWCEWKRIHGKDQGFRDSLTARATNVTLHLCAMGCSPIDITDQVGRLVDQNLPSSRLVRHKSFLDLFNDFAEFQAMSIEMFLRLEEIELLINQDETAGLKEKCEHAIEFFNAYLEWFHTHDEEFDSASPKLLAFGQMLYDGATGCEPAVIRANLQQHSASVGQVGTTNRR